jgi:hypothetical protein
VAPLEIPLMNAMPASAVIYLMSSLFSRSDRALPKYFMYFSSGISSFWTC